MSAAAHPGEVQGRELAELIEAVELPENQGDPLLVRDYVLLLLATVAVPVVLILIGGPL